MMRFWMILGLVCLLVSAVYAADQSVAPAQPASQAKVVVQFEDVDASEALVTLSQKAQITILGDATVKGKVTSNFLKETPVEEILDTICKPINLEWYKASVSVAPNEKPSAQKILALMDALKALGTTTLICRNPATQQQTIFAPALDAGAVNIAPVADSLKLKTVYVVRALPKVVDPNAAKEAGPLGQPPAEVAAAANQVWNYFSQMQPQTQMQVMRELGRMVFQNMSPEQMQQMRDQWRQNNPNGGDRGSWRGDRQGTPDNHNHGGQQAQ